MTVLTRKRCAIYTRKSTEEGLDQDFNSLDAQCEACEAYVKSQAGEGWELLPDTFDDGGWSGGNMDRPGLKALLTLIETGQIDIVVVYKVDRLTRSLADFAKMVEVFDKYGVSFVSVTQAFNTTNSMGRLTLNVLLSFAQFEREVTAERIRDKIKSSKERGMWMGGRPCLGYDVKDRRLIINEEEAQTVRHIFKRYIALKSVMELKEDLDKDRIYSKSWMTQKNRRIEGKPFSTGALYHLLQNQIYRGKICHKEIVHDGQHAPLMDETLWQRVQDVLGTNRRSHLGRTNAKAPSLLAGLIIDSTGRRLAPSQASKSGKIFRYYRVNTVSSGSHQSTTHLPAAPIEKLVLDTLKNTFEDQTKILAIVTDLGIADADLDIAISRARNWTTTLGEDVHTNIATLNLFLDRVVIKKREIEVWTKTAALSSILAPDLETKLDQTSLMVASPSCHLKRSGNGHRLVIPAASGGVSKDPDPKIIKTLARAHLWLEQLTSGQVRSFKEIAVAEGIDQRYVARVSQLAFLAPEIVKAIFSGKEPEGLSSEKLIRTSNLSTKWEKQAEQLSFGD